MFRDAAREFERDRAPTMAKWEDDARRAARDNGNEIIEPSTSARSIAPPVARRDPRGLKIGALVQRIRAAE